MAERLTSSILLTVLVIPAIYFATRDDGWPISKTPTPDPLPTSPVIATES